MSGTLRPGTFIRLDETAAELGVSVTPVREALLKLRGEGMVQLEPHRGHVVLPLTRQDIQDIFWLQATIAKELAAAATDHITDAEIDAAFSTLVQLRAGALIIAPDQFYNDRRERIAALALRHALPSVYGRREYAVAGGLMSYGTNLSDIYL